MRLITLNSRVYLLITVTMCLPWMSHESSVVLQQICQTVEIKTDVCPPFEVRGCIPKSLDPAIYINVLRSGISLESCHAVQLYSCSRQSSPRAINKQFCTGDDPGFCKAQRISLQSMCMTDDDCKANNVLASAENVSATCCDTWKGMQPCDLSDAEMEIARETEMCSRQNDCAQIPASSERKRSWWCFFAPLVSFLFQNECHQ